MEHNDKQKICSFSVVPGNGQALLGRPDIETLNILTVNCNTIGIEKTHRAAKCSTDTATSQGLGCEHHYTNARQTG